MMKQTICQRTTYSLVKEDEHGGDLDPLFWVHPDKEYLWVWRW